MRVKAVEYQPLARLVKRFRILRNWTVRWATKADGLDAPGGGVHRHRRQAIIARWSGGPEPLDYRIHEVLHVALRAMQRAAHDHEIEEEFVQDVCAMLRAAEREEKEQSHDRTSR